MTIDLTQIILAILTFIFGILMRYAIPSIKAKTSSDQMEILRAVVKTVVYGVEQLYKSKPGQEKKQLVIQKLAEMGYIVDVEHVEDTLDFLIESIVKELNIEQNEHINK